MPLILLDDGGAGGVGGDLDTRGFGIGIEAIAPPILDLGLFFALTLLNLRRLSGWLCQRQRCSAWDIRMQNLLEAVQGLILPLVVIIIIFDHFSVYHTSGPIIILCRKVIFKFKMFS